MDSRQLLTLEEAVLFLGIGKTKFYEYLKAGLIPFFQPRPCDARMYWRRDLLSFIRSNKSDLKPTQKPHPWPIASRPRASGKPSILKHRGGVALAGMKKIFSIYNHVKIMLKAVII